MPIKRSPRIGSDTYRKFERYCSAGTSQAQRIGRLYSDWFLVVNLAMETVLLVPSRCGAHRFENAMMICLRESIE